MKRPKATVIDRPDLKRGKRAAVRKARMATHRREVIVELATELEQISKAEDRVMRLKARLAATAIALKGEIGPASLLAFMGSIAGSQADELRRAK
jgi:hypothetical protein